MTKPKAPLAKKLPHRLEKHGDVRIDNYYWMNDRENPAVIAYLEEENAYYHQMTSHTKDFQDRLFMEMKGRIKEDDESVPYKQNGFWYMTRFETGQQYPVYSRKRESLDAQEEIMFNCNAMAQGHDFFNLGGISVSPNNEMAAFAIDTVSRRQYTLQIKNLKTGEIYRDKIENTSGGAVWAEDNKTIFYTQKNPVTLRSDKIFKHVLGTTSDQDELVYHEKDETFGTYVYRTKSKKFIIISSY
ncbi:MAG: oligopeptidase B, partial [Flavobacteriaceae bacterium]